MSVCDLAAAVRRREVSAVEVVEHHLRRIEEHRSLGAFLTVAAEQAVEEARRADRLAGSGAELPPLHGVPVAVKDLTLTAGLRTTFGSAVFADHVPVRDDDVVTALRAAGTVTLGKTTCSEFGHSLHSHPAALGPPARNPWRTDLTAGGSSGGSAAAVAAGLVPAAHATDGGGSIRIPAAICGVVGFKPTRGVVPTGPVGAAGFGLPTAGPVTRTVADAGALLDAMAVPAPGDPYLPPPPPPGGYLAAARTPDPGRRLRVGVWTTPVLSDVEPHPDCLAAVTATATVFADAGHDVVEVAPPLDTGVGEAFETLYAVMMLVPVPPAREAELLPLTRWLRERGRGVDAARLLRTLERVSAMVREGARRLSGVDLLVSPVLATPQAPVDHLDPYAADPAELFDREKRMSPYTFTYNLTGAPAVSLPVGTTADGLPVGVMVAARPGDDATLLRAAAFVEQALPWAHRRPPGS